MFASGNILFPQFCDVVKLAIYAQEDLVNFGYRPKMKVEYLKNSSYILATCWNLL